MTIFTDALSGQGGQALSSAADVREAHLSKRRQILAIAARHGGGAVLLTSQSTLAWYLEGARVGVSRAGEPILAVVVGAEEDELLVHSNEAERVVAEETASAVLEGTRIVRVPWYESLKGSVGNQGRVIDEHEIARDLRDARRQLFSHEVDAYRELGRDVAVAVTEVLSGAEDARNEREIAGELSGAIEGVGADPLVVLVGGAARSQHRHPLPTDAVLGRRALVVVCARRHGLIANLSRWVGETPTPHERDLEQRIAGVEAAALAATRPGAALKDVLSAIAAAYPAHGFDADEWRRHHQGGPTGFAGRDPRATPYTDDTVVTGQAFAWNPTAHGAKIEDTVLLTESGFEVLTVDPRWPAELVAGRSRPVTLTPR